MLGLLGVDSICVYFSWNVPCQPSCTSWHQGTILTLLVLLICCCYIVGEPKEKIELSISSGVASGVFLIFLIFFSLFPFFLIMSFVVFQLALFILVAGILCIYINYDCDRQRQEFRGTNGKCSVWGKAPSKACSTYHMIFIWSVSSL